MSLEDGGPAFASPGCGTACGGFDWVDPQKGMTLRDYFAAKALQGLVAIQSSYMNQEQIDNVVVQSFSLADAMLEARDK